MSATTTSTRPTEAMPGLKGKGVLVTGGTSGIGQAIAVKFAELERRLDANDGALKTLFDAIRELLKPAPTPEVRREIGFHIKEQARRYKTRMDI